MYGKMNVHAEIAYLKCVFNLDHSNLSTSSFILGMPRTQQTLVRSL